MEKIPECRERTLKVGERTPSGGKMKMGKKEERSNRTRQNAKKYAKVDWKVQKTNLDEHGSLNYILTDLF